MRTATYEPRERASWNLAASVRQGIDYGTWSSRWATRTRTRPVFRPVRFLYDGRHADLAILRATCPRSGPPPRRTLGPTKSAPSVDGARERGVPAVTGRPRDMGLSGAVRARLLRAHRRAYVVASRAAREPRRHGRHTRRRRTHPRGYCRCWMSWLRALLAGARDEARQPAPAPGRWAADDSPPADEIQPAGAWAQLVAFIRIRADLHH